jgi:hypothetical protein
LKRLLATSIAPLLTTAQDAFYKYLAARQAGSDLQQAATPYGQIA